MSTGTMPVAALAATLLLALPAADAAGAPSPHTPDPAPAVPRQAAAADGIAAPPPAPDQAPVETASGGLRLAALGGLTATEREAKATPFVPKGPQLATLEPVAVEKPGAKPQASGPIPRPAAQRPAPPRHATRPLAARPATPLPDLLPVSAQSGAAEMVPAVAHAPHQVGVASYYARHFTGRLMANGQRFDPHSDSIAHRSLPFGTRVRIVNMTNGRVVTGTVRDRGPFHRGRLLDVSPRIAQDLGMMQAGVARVAVWRDGREPTELAEAQ